MKQTIIKVLAKPGLLVPMPRLRGAIAQYVGRTVEHSMLTPEINHNVWAPNPDIELDLAYPVDPKGQTFDKRSDLAVFNEIFRAVKNGELLPADEFTAQYCGVAYPKRMKKDVD